MDTPTLKTRVDELKAEVAPYSQGKIKQPGFSLSFENKVYIGITFLILVFLLLLKPKFVQTDYIDSQAQRQYKFSINKFLSYWVVLSVLGCLGFYGYQQSRNSQVV